MNYSVCARGVVQCNLRNDFFFRGGRLHLSSLVFLDTRTAYAVYVTFRTSFIAMVTIKIYSFSSWSHCFLTDGKRREGN
jgi:hypothetical protein